MIRVFLISLVALVALAMVAHHLPAELRPAGGDDESLLGRWEGAWEGTLVSYRPDGSTLQSVRARYEYRRVSATEQTLVMTDRAADGSTRGSTGAQALIGDAFERTIALADGKPSRFSGRRVGDAIFWHHRDAATGAEETYREQILSTPDGDLYTIDGAGSPGKEGLLLFEGRFHRVDRAGE